MYLTHLDTFTRAISNVLSSPEAELTLGQIIDGLPISDVAFDVREGCYCPGHPLRDERMELSPGILERARQLRNDFDANSLRMESSVSYWATSINCSHILTPITSFFTTMKPLLQGQGSFKRDWSSW